MTISTASNTPSTNEGRRSGRRSLAVAVGVLAVVGLAACSKDDVANDALRDAGVDAQVSTGGDLPSGFPDVVPTPDLKLETGVQTTGTFTLRYTADDPAGDFAAYRKQLEDAGFAVTATADNLANPGAGGNIAMSATGSGYAVAVSAFAADAPGGGNYMAVVVAPG